MSVSELYDAILDCDADFGCVYQRTTGNPGCSADAFMTTDTAGMETVKVENTIDDEIFVCDEKEAQSVFQESPFGSNDAVASAVTNEKTAEEQNCGVEMFLQDMREISVDEISPENISVSELYNAVLDCGVDFSCFYQQTVAHPSCDDDVFATTDTTGMTPMKFENTIDDEMVVCDEKDAQRVFQEFPIGPKDAVAPTVTTTTALAPTISFMAHGMPELDLNFVSWLLSSSEDSCKGCERPICYNVGECCNTAEELIDGVEMFLQNMREMSVDEIVYETMLIDVRNSLTLTLVF